MTARGLFVARLAVLHRAMASRPTYPKSTCCIMGCQSWSRKFPDEWICPDHWRLVPPPTKRVLRRMWKLPTWTMRNERRHTRIWNGMKRRVTLHCAGI